MTALNVRPVTDLRNHYADVEGDIARGPVFLTKNGYGASVVVSMDYFQWHLAQQDIPPAISHCNTRCVGRTGKDFLATG